MQKQQKEKKNTDVNSTISGQLQEVLFLEEAIYRRLQLYRKKKNMTIFVKHVTNQIVILYEVSLAGHFMVILREDLFYQSQRVPLKTISET